MHLIDWLIVLIPLYLLFHIAFKSQKYVKGVADFLAAGRVAGRYVVSVASGEAGLGLISVVAIFEMYYRSGFAVSFWSRLTGPLGLLFALTGFCTYRFRETDAMTMGQFLEMRYSRGFRVFAAILQSISGIINYALFPAVGARFMIYYMDLPLKVHFLGMNWPTFGLLMALFLLMAVIIVTMGGQITIMVTDCVQGLVSYPLYIVIVFFILYRFSWWDEMAPTLLARPEGESFLNPFDVDKMRDFNLFYVFVGIFGSVLNRMSWSGSQGYNCAAKNAHEQKMGGLLGTWRGGMSTMMYVMLAVAVYTYMHNADFTSQAARVGRELSYKTMEDVASGDKLAPTREWVKTEILKDAPVEGVDYRGQVKQEIAKVDKAKAGTFDTIYGQMLATVAVRDMLPIGVSGAFVAVMFFLMLSTDTTYIHSWGSILVQDLILPFRKTPFTPKQQLNLLRLMMCLVAAFALVFSMFFAQVDYILMFFAITGAIWTGGAGSVITFGLYWKRGTTAGAFAALISGSSIATFGIILQKLWAAHVYPWLEAHDLVTVVGNAIEACSRPFEPYICWRMDAIKFPINSQEISFLSIVVSVGLYVIVSLLTCKKPFNMDKMLHRGAYSRNADAASGNVKKETLKEKLWRLFIGIDKNYTKGDKVLAWSVFIWSFFYGFILNFIVILIWNSIKPWPNSWWSCYFYLTSILVPGLIAIVSSVWFTWGGTVDLHRLFVHLAEKKEDVEDDGRVQHEEDTPSDN